MDKQPINFSNDIAYDDYYLDEYKKLIWKEGKGYEASPFKDRTYAEVFLCAMALGFKNKSREKFKGKRIPQISIDALKEKGRNLILSLAISESNDLEILYDPKAVYDIAEEYANGGIPLLLKLVKPENNIGSPLLRMEEMIFKDIEIIENNSNSSSDNTTVITPPLNSTDKDDHLTPFEMLEKLELTLRSLIQKKLTEISPEWEKERVPSAILANWRDKRKSELYIVPPPSSSKPLISYSYLGELKDIILKSENWKEKFKQIFRNEDSFKGSMAALIPIRNQVMHSGSTWLDDLQKQTLKHHYDILMRLIDLAD